MNRAVWAFLTALSCALFANGPASAGRLEREVEQAMRRPVPADGIAVAVTLRRDDLPARGVLRRQRIRERQSRVLDALPPGTFHLGRRFASLAGFSGWAKPRAIVALRRNPEVDLVYVDGMVQAMMAEGVPLVGADHAHVRGITGDGVNVAVLDTGIDTDHPDLASSVVAEQCFCAYPLLSFIGCCPGGATTRSGPGSAEDDQEHGTAVSGVITSDGVDAPSGMAPDAGIVAVKVLSRLGTGRFSDIAAGLDWVLANHEALGIRAVNMSVGDIFQHKRSDMFPCRNTNVANAIKSLRDEGVAVFVASGNNGFDQGISFPACVAEAISVGGVYDAFFDSVSWCKNASCSQTLCTDAPANADSFVCHSNSGPILDLLAPNWKTTTSRLGGGTLDAGGTSLATPYAAGAAALLFQADPMLTVDEVEALLEGHGPLVTNPDSGLSFPRFDVGEAVDEVLGP